MQEPSENKIEIAATGLAVGGDGVGRHPDGRAVFVPGLLPGETALVELTETKKRFARGQIAELLEAAPERRDPPCPNVNNGCGGCGLQHASVEAQRRYRRQMVVDALERIARIDGPEVRPGPDLRTEELRTTLRLGVDKGVVGFRRPRSHELVAIDACLVAHPLLAELLIEGRFATASEVTLRAGAGTGERMVIVDPSSEGVVMPDAVAVIGQDELRRGRTVAIHEEVAHRRWRISARSFFQTSQIGAEALVTEVKRAVGPTQGRVVDAYGGVGLLTAAVPDAHTMTVERSASSVRDAEHNLAGRDARIDKRSFERWSPLAADVVIADPSRDGLGADAVGVIAATEAATVVLVSCDAGSLGRDARLLTDAGYRLAHSTLLDLFPHTPHVEVVSRFVSEPDP